jgi:hypothetical protein
VSDVVDASGVQSAEAKVLLLPRRMTRGDCEAYTGADLVELTPWTPLPFVDQGGCPT